MLTNQKHETDQCGKRGYEESWGIPYIKCQQKTREMKRQKMLQFCIVVAQIMAWINQRSGNKNLRVVFPSVKNHDGPQKNWTFQKTLIPKKDFNLLQ